MVISRWCYADGSFWYLPLSRNDDTQRSVLSLGSSADSLSGSLSEWNVISTVIHAPHFSKEDEEESGKEERERERSEVSAEFENRVWSAA